MSERRADSLRWRRAVSTDIPALSAFLKMGEERRVGFSGRLLREGSRPLPTLRLPSILRGSVWLASIEDTTVSGAILCHPSRLVFPILPAEELGGDRSFALLTSSFQSASVIGMASDVARYESARSIVPKASIAYRLMTRPEGRHAPVRLTVPPYQGLVVRRATADDLDALVPLQEAYEHEEVLTPIHVFNPAACKVSLARAIERQLVFAAEEGGVIVGKAGTNARGFHVDQIGGVYTLPARRGRGVAAALMAALLADIHAQGRKPSLFVKPANIAAMALYHGLGFEEIGDYRADYFET